MKVTTPRPARRATRRGTVRGLALTAAAASVALVLGACSQDSSSTALERPTGQTITVWLIQPSQDQDAANDYLRSTFEAKFPGNTVAFKEQSWSTYKDVYTKTLVDGDGEVPDVVEMGNTDTPGFTAAGALLDLTDKLDDLGGSDLLPGFVAIGSYDGRFFAPPYYSGARVVFGESSVVGSQVPATLGDYVQAGERLTKAGRSGIFAPGQDWYNVLPYVWENGGYIAQQNSDGTWKAGFSTPGGIAGLQEMQEVFTKANSAKVAPPRSDEVDGAKKFCEGKVGYLAGPTWLAGSIAAGDGKTFDGCATTHGKNLTVFALPGKEPGTVAKTFAGGSNLGIPAKSTHRELAYEALKIMVSPGYQDLLALKGFIPARISSAVNLPQDAGTLEGAKAAQNAVLTPASPKWSQVEGKRYLQDAFSEIAAGGDVTAIAKKLDGEIESTLNS